MVLPILFHISTNNYPISDHSPIDNKYLPSAPAIPSLPSPNIVFAISVPGVSDPVFWREMGVLLAELE
jgi:hypothetical protein